METASNRMVALCDILGFSALIDSQPLSQVVGDYIPCLLNLLENSVTQQQPVGADLSITRLARSDRVGVSWFSDTILIYALDDSDDACKKVVETAGWLLFRTFFNAPKTRVRVGVSYGEFYVNQKKDLLLGKAIVEAYRVEKEQDWMGGALSKSAEARMGRILNLLNPPPGWWLKPYRVPVKGGKYSGLVSRLVWSAIWQSTGLGVSIDSLTCHGRHNLPNHRTRNGSSILTPAKNGITREPSTEKYASGANRRCQNLDVGEQKAVTAAIIPS